MRKIILLLLVVVLLIGATTTFGAEMKNKFELPNNINIRRYYNPLSRTWVDVNQEIEAKNHNTTYYLDGIKNTDGVTTIIFGDPLSQNDILANRWKTGSIFDNQDTGAVTTNADLINAFDYAEIARNSDLAKPMFRGFTNGGQVFYNPDFVNDAASSYEESQYAAKEYYELINYQNYPAFGRDNRIDVYQRYFGRKNDYFEEPIVQQNLKNLKAEYFPNSPNITLRFLYDHFNPLSIQTEESVGSWVAWWYNDYFGNNRYRTFTIPPLKVYENDLVAENIVIEDASGRDVTGELLNPNERYTAHYNVSTTSAYNGPIELSAYYFSSDTNGQMAMVGSEQNLGVNANLSAGEVVTISHEISGMEDVRIKAGITTPVENSENSVRENDFFEYETPEPIFNLRATNFDLSGESVYAGGRVETSVDFENESSQFVRTKGWLVVDGVVEESFSVDLAPGEITSFSHDLELMEASEVYYEINPDRDLEPETTYADNRTSIRRVIIDNGLCPLVALPNRTQRVDAITYDMNLNRQYERRDRVYEEVWDPTDRRINQKYDSEGNLISFDWQGGYDRVWTGEYTDWYDAGWRFVQSEESNPINIKEEYNITDIEYRSKWNDHEWTEDGAIKAGYGFEMRVNTEYKVSYDGTQNIPNHISGNFQNDETIYTPNNFYFSYGSYENRGNTFRYTDQYYWNYNMNIPSISDNDCLTVEMPDGETFRSSFRNSSRNPLEITNSINNPFFKQKTYEFKEINRDVVGLSRKYYVDEDVADGNYELEIFTGPVGIQENLSDSKISNFEVYGSYYEDVVPMDLN